MTGQVSNRQPILTNISRGEDSFFCYLDIHTNNVLAEMLNNKVKARLNDIIIQDNEMFGFNYYQQIPMKKNITEKQKRVL